MIKRTQNIYASIFTILILAGCASPAKMENMVYSDQSMNFDPDLNRAINVDSVKGGEKTNPLWASQIGNAEFKGALLKSLDAHSLLAANTDSKYELHVDLIRVDQPVFGLDLEVKTRVKYTLLRKSDSEVIYTREILAAFTAGFSDAAVAIRRLRLANEGSAKTNIKDFLNDLSQLNINKGEISLAR